MIKKEELLQIAAIKGLSEKNAEKDYLQDLILHYIYRNVSDMFVFKGGTALYKVYSLNRFSEDLDFTLNKRKIDLDKLLEKIMHIFSLIGIKGKIEELEDFQNQVNARLSFAGPLYNGTKQSLCYIILNISTREKTMDETKKATIHTIYSDIPEFELFVMSQEELLAEKLRIIIVRDKTRDIFDAWFLLKRGTKINHDILEKKMQRSKAKFSKKIILEKIEKSRGIWETNLKSLILGSLPPFDQVKKEIGERL